MPAKKKSALNLFQSASTTGALIKAFRKNFGVSQNQMAEVCNITQSNLSKIENNEREVGADVALRLAAFMGLSPDVILYPGGYESQPEYREVRQRSASVLLGKGRR